MNCKIAQKDHINDLWQGRGMKEEAEKSPREFACDWYYEENEDASQSLTCKALWYLSKEKE